MLIKDITNLLETLAPTALQESYDNAGLITGQAQWPCTGILVALDALEAVIDDAIGKKCNLVVAHHPILFGAVKSLTGKTYVERVLIKAIKNDIAIYAIHTNLDNAAQGVNSEIANRLGLINTRVLSPKQGVLVKLATYVPVDNAAAVRDALFAAGAGHIGNYSECSFALQGRGTFRPGAGTQPHIGTIGKREELDEIKIEVIIPQYMQQTVLQALRAAHPYQEVAYEIMPLLNDNQYTGSGMLGYLQQPKEERVFLERLKNTFNVAVIRHTTLLHKPIATVAVCGGAGSFLIKKAMAAQADIYITADVKYHEFFDADNKMVIADIGHYESEQFTIDLLFDFLQTKFPNFAILKTQVHTNPVHYF